MRSITWELQPVISSRGMLSAFRICSWLRVRRGEVRVDADERMSKAMNDPTMIFRALGPSFLSVLVSVIVSVDGIASADIAVLFNGDSVEAAEVIVPVGLGVCSIPNSFEKS